LSAAPSERRTVAILCQDGPTLLIAVGIKTQSYPCSSVFIGGKKPFPGDFSPLHPRYLEIRGLKLL
jgi:hypothetical protein